jgi:hypothetical protein
MKIKNTVVNANENSIFLGDLYHGYDCCGMNNARRLKYRPLAHNLIEKYWNSPYKAMQASRQFEQLEMHIVTLFDLADGGYDPKEVHPAWRSIRMQYLDLLAFHLDISPIILYNDADLPVYLRP